MKKIIPIMLTLILVNIIFVSADFAPPQFFEGSVTFTDNTLIPNGYVITAKINELGGSTVKIINGQYENLQIRPPFGVTGEVYFLINGVRAITTAPFNRGHTTELNIIIDESFIPEQNFCGDENCDVAETCSSCPSDCGECPIEFCGDGLCNNGETCSTCSQDCGICPPTNDNNDNNDNSPGGGSPSGGSPSGDNPIITTSETIDTQTNTSEDEEDNSIDLISDENQETTGSGITGGVIGFIKSGSGIALIFAFLIVVLVIGVMLALKRKSPKNE